MTEANAAQVEESNLDEGLDQPEVEVNSEAQSAESAPADTETEGAQEVFQKRINKEVGRTYTEKRRADDLQRQLDEVKSKPVTVSEAPKLEDFDHDEEKFNSALIDHKVSQAVKAQEVKSQENARTLSAQEAQRTFNERIVALNNPDFADIANAVPELPAGVADALVQSENGPELIVHLGTHLDMADKLANMTPHAAIMELGRISANMSAKQDVKPSAAPDPIEPLNSGGSIAKDRGPKGAKFE